MTLGSYDASTHMLEKRPLKIYYRISDNSLVKERFGDKKRCLENFLRTFAPAPDEVVVIADRCQEPTLQMIQDLFAESHGSRSGKGAQLPSEWLVRTDIGHGSGSFRKAAEMAMTLPDSEMVYFLEDDYLHLPGARQLIVEGLQFVAPYVTLYDHPDKYVNASQGGNPLIEGGGEVTRVLRTPLSHWKHSNSTTMTFATTVGVLRKDMPVWNFYTRDPYPDDFRAFLDLNRRGRRVGVSIPGRSTHCDPKWPTPGVDWDKV